FFFQAEDGIRDPLVTGVQTCALPISLQRPPAHAANVRGWFATVTRNVARKFVRGESRRKRREEAAADPRGRSSARDASVAVPPEIGRAAGRGRGRSSGGRGSREK